MRYSNARDILPNGWAAARWVVGNHLRVRIDIGSSQFADKIDATWPSLRPDDALNAHWRWQAILDRARVGLVLIDADLNQPLAAIAFKRRYVLPGPPKGLRLDYIEIAPNRKRIDLGTLAMGLVVEFALFRECEHIVLGALDDPGVLKFYEALGGHSHQTPWEWAIPPDTVPVSFDLNKMRVLKQWTDERRQDN